MKCLVHINTIPLKNIYLYLKDKYESFYYLDNKKIMIDDSTNRISDLNDHEFSHVFLSNKKINQEFVKKCINNKKYVYVYNNLDNLKEFDNLSNKNKSILYIGNELLFHPLNNKIKNLDKTHNFSYNIFSEFTKDSYGNSYKNEMISELVVSIDLFGKMEKIKLNKDYGPITSYNLYYKNRDRSCIEINKTRRKVRRLIELFSKTNINKDYLVDDFNIIYLPKSNVSESHKKEELLKYTIEDFLLKKENDNEKNIYISELINKIK